MTSCHTGGGQNLANSEAFIKKVAQFTNKTTYASMSWGIAQQLCGYWGSTRGNLTSGTKDDILDGLVKNDKESRGKKARSRAQLEQIYANAITYNGQWISASPKGNIKRYDAIYFYYGGQFITNQTGAK